MPLYFGGIKIYNMRVPENHTIVIFGASGDLTSRKLIPSLYNLYRQRLMPKDFRIIGLGRSELETDAFRKGLNTFYSKISNGKSIDNKFLSTIDYLVFDYENEKSYIELSHKMFDNKDLISQEQNVLFYLATPPSLYETISGNLSKTGMNKGPFKIVFEKPFGYDLDSARELNKNVLKCFNENQVYRIDHYLGKETVQNILVTRFSNTFFEPLWNRNYIHHIEITSAESIGVEKRGGYYDGSGALRDMVQNHLMQLAGLVAMEPPVTSDATSIRNEMVKVFQSLRPLSREDIRNNVIRGQYLSGKVKNNTMKSYRDEDGVDKDSRTETFAALKFYIDNWRWNGVPFYIRSGKRLPTRVSEIVIHFSATPHHIFCNSQGTINESNSLIIRIQPDEGILLKFGMKVPGAGFTVQDVNMDFHYKDLSDEKIPDAYERLLLDCMLNDPTLYSRGDAVENTWMFIDPILKAWKEEPDIPLYGYPAGTWGPEIADNLIEEPDITWRYPCKNLSDDGLYCEL